MKWATEALDEVRRGAWNDARRQARATEPKRSRGRPRNDAPPRAAGQKANGLKGARQALWKNPENLTGHQQAKLDWIAKTDPTLHRGYLLKEGLGRPLRSVGPIAWIQRASGGRSGRTDDPKQSLNCEIRRRTAVVGIFPDRNSIIRLVGTVLA